MAAPAVLSSEVAVELAESLLVEAIRRRGRRERARAARMSRLLAHPDGLELVVALTDEVLRIKDPARAASVLRDLAATEGLSRLGPIDRLSMRIGARLSQVIPRLVMPVVRKRVRVEMGQVILPAGNRRLALHAARRRRQGIRLNVNVLGEAIVGDEEARHRLERIKDMLSHPSVDYVSVKISSICAQLDVLRFDFEVERIAAPLRELYDIPGFVNLDMEEYRDLELTVAVFKKLLDEPAYERLTAGIVLQAYLPDSLDALKQLCAWARSRRDRTGGQIKVRIVKGANLAMERVEAEIRGWPQAPHLTKDETDANYKRMLEVALDPANDGAVRVGIASHNLFEIAWAATRAKDLGATGRIEFEMLEGMSPAVARTVADRLDGLRLYAPFVERSELEAGIAYLVRRLDENTTPENFLAQQFSLRPGSPEWKAEADRFRRSVSNSTLPPAASTRRVQDRRIAHPVRHDGFANEPDTDFTIAANRVWIAEHLDSTRLLEYVPVVGGSEMPTAGPQEGIDPSSPDSPAYCWHSADEATVETALAAAREAQPRWANLPAEERRLALLRAAHALSRARGRLLAVMALDTGKTVREGDPEVSEAVDFAAYYAGRIPTAGFQPHGTVVVASPWNFPLSIPAGGVLAALAAGNAVILKPAPEAVAVAGELARVLWDAGIPRDVLQFVPCVDGAASRRLITESDAVILTGSWETARLFLGWRPRLPLHAETSGKNSMIITATADLDDAVADLVRSAFGHAGQKCSAASVAIIEAKTDPRFLRRLADAVRTLRVGPAWDLSTSMGPVIRPPEGPLLRALTVLDPGEEWLVEPRQLHGNLWSPGVKIGVEPGSWFHLTECFGPVLGVMRAENLEQAIEWQNQPAYGLTAGLHALDPTEIARWREQVQAGNLYVNRVTTGAIVRRQPFGGWKRSVIGPGAKAGGPNYVASLGSWPAAHDIGDYAERCRKAWAEMCQPVDETGLVAESNAFRYVPLKSVLIVGGTPDQVQLARAAAEACGVEVAEDETGVDKVRFLGDDESRRLAALDAGLWVDDLPVAADPARELLRWVREQAVSESRHRHGNITNRRPGLISRATPAR